MGHLLEQISWLLVVVLCATLGLSPYVPEPHIWEKLMMLRAGDPLAAIDWFDLAMHGLPWLLLLAKLGRASLRRGTR